MNFTIFQTFATQIEQPLLNAVDGVSDQMLNAVSAPLHIALVIYIAWLGYSVLFGHMTEPLRDVWGKIARAAIIAGLLTAGTYDPWIRDFVLNGLPNDLMGAVTGGGAAVNAAAFDHIWNLAFIGGATVYESLPGLSFSSVGLEILIGLYWLVAIISIAFCFLVWMVSHIVLGLLVAIGPIFVATYLFAATKSLGERWVSTALGMIALQFLIVSLLVILIPVENQMMAGIKAADVNPVAQIQILLAAVVFFAIALGVVIQLPGVALALTGGFHYHAQNLARQVFGGSAAAGGFAAKQAGRGAVAAARAVAGRTPGSSLSRGP